jgi:hypothetical protein
MKAILLIVFAITTAAHADEYVRCFYELPELGTMSFVERADDVQRWLDAKRADHSIPDWDSKPRCEPLDLTPVYHLLTRAANGTVSLQSGLTEDACQTISHRLTDPPCSDSCSWIEQPVDIRTAQCFK